MVNLDMDTSRGWDFCMSGPGHVRLPDADYLGSIRHLKGLCPSELRQLTLILSPLCIHRTEYLNFFKYLSRPQYLKFGGGAKFIMPHHTTNCKEILAAVSKPTAKNSPDLHILRLLLLNSKAFSLALLKSL